MTVTREAELSRDEGCGGRDSRWSPTRSGVPPQARGSHSCQCGEPCRSCHVHSEVCEVAGSSEPVKIALRSKEKKRGSGREDGSVEAAAARAATSSSSAPGAAAAAARTAARSSNASGE